MGGKIEAFDQASARDTNGTIKVVHVMTPVNRRSTTISASPESEVSVEEPLPSSTVDPVEQLAHLVPALWRTLTRASRSAQEMPANESQVSILRRVVAVGSLSPTQLADDLHIARPTVSNLLKGLVDSGMVERRHSEQDARTVLVSATDYGRTVLETFRRDRAEVLRDALADLDDVDHDAILSAVPSFRRLLRRLEIAAADEIPASASETA